MLRPGDSYLMGGFLYSTYQMIYSWPIDHEPYHMLQKLKGEVSLSPVFIAHIIVPSKLLL